MTDPAPITHARPFATDLTEEQWAKVQPLLPPRKPVGRKRTTDYREVLNAIRYYQGTPGTWRELPGCFPPHETVYTYYRDWQRDGLLGRVLLALRERENRHA
jgi:transposase